MQCSVERSGIQLLATAHCAGLPDDEKTRVHCHPARVQSASGSSQSVGQSWRRSSALATSLVD
eukprot:8651420-Prorocentrum_lima.AAC.1